MRSKILSANVSRPFTLPRGPSKNVIIISNTAVDQYFVMNSTHGNASQKSHIPNQNAVIFAPNAVHTMQLPTACCPHVATLPAA